MADVLNTIGANLVDACIYIAIALVALVGICKCVLPVRRAARCLRRGTHALETMVPRDGARPLWQDALFLGAMLQAPWRQFLYNAEELDARGICCDVSQYINDDSVIYEHGHAQLADIVPGLLTSLGILGTFIGLMRGLGGLDVSDAAKTMESIPDMIGGMSFAFSTSIAGISCSLCFNLLNRIAVGNATNAIDDFYDAFSELVMQKPLESDVQTLCLQQDRSAFLHQAVTSLSQSMTEGVTSAVTGAFAPIGRSMNDFIMAQTQAQIEGIGRIAAQFVTQMNQQLGGQFLQLGKTLDAVNHAQRVNLDGMNTAMAAAEGIMQNLDDMQHVMGTVMERFEGYVASLAQAQEQNAAMTQDHASALAQMHQAAQAQNDLLAQVRDSQTLLQRNMREYADWSGHVLDALGEQGRATADFSKKTAEELRASGEKLSGSYDSFVQNVTTGLAKSLGMFDESVSGLIKTLSQKLDELKKLSQSGQQTQFIQAAGALERTVSELKTALDKSGSNAGVAV